MVVTDVDEVVGTGTEGGDGDGATAVEPSNRFDRIKESYKGVASALDLSEEASAYEDFASLLGDHKVRGSLSPSARPCCAVRAIHQVLQFLPYFWFIGAAHARAPVRCSSTVHVSEHTFKFTLYNSIFMSFAAEHCSSTQNVQHGLMPSSARLAVPC